MGFRHTKLKDSNIDPIELREIYYKSDYDLNKKNKRYTEYKTYIDNIPEKNLIITAMIHDRYDIGRHHGPCENIDKYVIEKLNKKQYQGFLYGYDNYYGECVIYMHWKNEK